MEWPPYPIDWKLTRPRTLLTIKKIVSIKIQMTKKKKKKPVPVGDTDSQGPFFAFVLKHRTIIPLLLISLLGILVYANTFKVPFVFDDRSGILENPEIRSFHDAIHTANLSRVVGVLTFAFNYQLNNINVTGYHIVNLLIHIGDALMVFLLISLTLGTPYFRNRLSSTAAGLKDQTLIVALFAALFFVAHPVETQAVTYTVQRFTSLSTLFFLLSLVMYAKYRFFSEATETEAKAYRIPAGPRERKIFSYVASLIAAVLAMLTKEIAFTLPVIIALWEFSFFSGGIKKRLLRVSPFLLMLPLIPFGHMFSGISLVSAAGETAPPPAVDYLLTQFRVIVTYLRLLVLPVGQNFDYDYPVYHSFAEPAVFLSFIFLAALLAGGILMYFLSAWKKGPPLLRLAAFGVLWFFITLSVESSIIPIADVIFEHRLYLPSIGFFMTAVVGVQMAISSRLGIKALAGKIAVIVMSLLVLTAAATAIARNNVWRDELHLWEDTVAKSPGSPRAHNNLGVAYTNVGEKKKAEEQFLLSIQLRPAYAAAHNNLGTAYQSDGEMEKARTEYLQALEVMPDYAQAHNNLGLVYEITGEPDKAANEFSQAIKYKPDYADAYYNLGMNFADKQSYLEALGLFQKAIELKPDYAEAHNNLGNIYVIKGQLDKALIEYQTAVKIIPGYQEAKDNIQYLKSIQSNPR